MTVLKTLAMASVMVFGMSFAASADTLGAHYADCAHKANAYSTAVKNAQPGKALDKAEKIATAAKRYCAINHYDRGVQLYDKAISLLDSK